MTQTAAERAFSLSINNRHNLQQQVNAGMTPERILKFLKPATDVGIFDMVTSEDALLNFFVLDFLEVNTNFFKVTSLEVPTDMAVNLVVEELRKQGFRVDRLPEEECTLRIHWKHLFRRKT
jgi:hypothetical protein